MNIASLSTGQLTQIIKIKNEIERLQAQLDKLATGADIGDGRRGPKFMSAEAREKIAAAQRRRWAKVKGKAATGKGPRRMFSAAGLARIRAAQKARWAKYNAGRK